MSVSSLAAVLGRIPSGIFVLTAAHQGDETGTLVSWVQQAGFEPPMITVALQRQRYLAEWLAAGAPLAINFLSEGQSRLMRHFSRGFEIGQPAFEGLEIGRTSRGLPFLSEAMGYLEAEPAGHVDSGDHRVFLARVLAGRLVDDAIPMIHVRKSGLRY